MGASPPIGMAPLVRLDRVSKIYPRVHRPGERLRAFAALLAGREPDQGAEVLTLFRELHAAGRTIVLITHDAEVAAAADRQVHLRDGRLAA